MADWDRQKGESSMWFERFETYRMMGPGRTLLGTVNEMVVSEGEKKRKSAPSSWEINFEKFKWRERATAWDDHQRHLTRVENEKARKKARKARVKLIMAGIEKCNQALDAVDPASAKFGEVMSGIKTLSEQARLEFGENAVTTPVSHDILESILAGEMTVREAALRYSKAGIPMPESVKILLSKEPPEDSESDETGDILTDEELERRYQEGMAAVEREIEMFVPHRREQVKRLKEELADQDSFAETA